jgi:leucyl-tRNA synthetase
MEQILANKGTGIVTSCPSGSADDYVMLTALQKKPAYYNIQEEWVKGFEPVAMIHTTAYGDLGAVKYCKDNKINSPKDKVLLDQAKEALYKEDFYKGTMLVGTCKGR